MGPRLLTWDNFDPKMDKWSQVRSSVGLNYLFIPKLQQLHCLGMGKDSITYFRVDVIYYPCWYYSWSMLV